MVALIHDGKTVVIIFVVAAILTLVTLSLLTHYDLGSSLGGVLANHLELNGKGWART